MGAGAGDALMQGGAVTAEGAPPARAEPEVGAPGAPGAGS